MSADQPLTGDELATIKARAEAIAPERRTWSCADEHGNWPGATPAWCINEMRDGEWVQDVAALPQVDWAEADAEHIAGMDPDTTLRLVAEVERLRAEVRDLSLTVENLEGDLREGGY